MKKEPKKKVYIRYPNPVVYAIYKKSNQTMYINEWHEGERKVIVLK